jgi:hypothetical protein
MEERASAHFARNDGWGSGIGWGQGRWEQARTGRGAVDPLDGEVRSRGERLASAAVPTRGWMFGVPLISGGIFWWCWRRLGWLAWLRRGCPW